MMHVELLSLPPGGSSLGVIPMWNFPRGAGAAFSSAFPPTSAFWSLIFSSLLLCMLLAAPADPGGGAGGRASCWEVSCSISCCQDSPLPGGEMCILCSLPSQHVGSSWTSSSQQLLCVALLPVQNGFCLISILPLPNEVVPPWWQSQPGK